METTTSRLSDPSTLSYKSILTEPIDMGPKSPTPMSTMYASGEMGSQVGFFSGNLFRYGFIVLILAFLGFNLFDYLGNITQFFANIFGPIILAVTKFFGLAVTETTKTVTDVAATGIKTGVDVAAGTITTSANVVEKALTGGQIKNNIDSSLDRALSKENRKPPEPIPDEAGSSTQSKTAKKSGFCYIGEDRGFRSCVKVNESDQCLSGDIFPTREICINPNLRE